MSDSEYEEDSYLESEEEEDYSLDDDDSVLDDEDDSQDIDFKVKKRSLNKMETKIAMKGKTKITKLKQEKVTKVTCETAAVKKREEKKQAKDKAKTEK